MHNGLKIVRLPVGRYGYMQTRVGWFRRIGGDEWEIVDSRPITRIGAARHDGFDRLASHGLEDRYKAYPKAAEPVPIHRLWMMDLRNANEKAWAKDCPKPKGWKDDE